MMGKPLVTVCMLLAACCSVQYDAPPVDTITPLEQACLRNPLDPENWERLAAVLAIAGERERAASMYLQAASLRRHDARQDYTTLKQALDEASMPRTQVRRIGPAMVEVLRVGVATSVDKLAPVRLEISNGNGVAGAAARLARRLEGDGFNTVRLSNMRPFMVSLSRIEYAPSQRAQAQSLAQRLHMPLRPRHGGTPYADMRIVLGRDARTLK